VINGKNVIFFSKKKKKKKFKKKKIKKLVKPVDKNTK